MTKRFRLSRFVLLAAVSMVCAPIARSNDGGLHFNIPPVGTAFLNDYYVTDSSGHIVPDTVAMSPMVPDEQHVLATGIKAYGRSNCIVLCGPSHPDTTFISYSKNGDLYILHRIDTGKVTWDWLPFSLKPGKVLKTKPAREVYFKNWVLMHRREIQVVGHDTVSVSGKVYDCIKLVDVQIRSEKGVDYKNAFTYWYSPELGYLLRNSFGWNGPYFLYQHVRDIRTEKP